jgi:hypothetical protein
LETYYGYRTGAGQTATILALHGHETRTSHFAPMSLTRHPRPRSLRASGTPTWVSR